MRPFKKMQQNQLGQLFSSFLGEDLFVFFIYCFPGSHKLQQTKIYKINGRLIVHSIMNIAEIYNRTGRNLQNSSSVLSANPLQALSSK